MKSLVSAASLEACCRCPSSPARPSAGSASTLGDELLSGDTSGFAATAISSSWPTLLEQALRRREVEAGERRAADRETRR